MTRAERFIEVFGNDRIFTISLYTQKDKKVDQIKAKTAKQAAELFIDKHFPGSIVYDVRWSQPTSDVNGVLYRNWTASTNASGQKVYIQTEATFG